MKYDPAAVLSVVHCHCGDCRRRTGANGPVTNFLIGLFAAPGKLVPEAHYHWSERLPWIRLSDGLPRHSGDKASARVEQDLAAE